MLSALKDGVCVGAAQTLHVIKLRVAGVWSLNCLAVSQLGTCKGFVVARDDGVACGYGGRVNDARALLR